MVNSLSTNCKLSRDVAIEIRSCFNMALYHEYIWNDGIYLHYFHQLKFKSKMLHCRLGFMMHKVASEGSYFYKMSFS